MMYHISFPKFLCTCGKGGEKGLNVLERVTNHLVPPLFFFPQKAQRA